MINVGTTILDKNQGVLRTIDEIYVEIHCPGYQTIVCFEDGYQIPLEDLYTKVFHNEEWVIFTDPPF